MVVKGVSMKEMPIRCCENCNDYLGCGEDVEIPDDCGSFSWSDAAITQMPKKKFYFLMVNPIFEKPIIEGLKIHTIRKNFEFWENRIESINRGEGILSIRVWTGKPCRSNQREIKRLEKCGIQRVIFSKDEELLFFDIERPGYNETLDTSLVAKNNGLTVGELFDWFKDYPEGYMAIIHFTDFRY
jgi:hypothetical protein